MTEQLPISRGIALGPSIVDPHGKLPWRLLEVGQAASLAEMEADFVFFTPALPALEQLWPDFMLIDFLSTPGNSDCVFYHRKFSQPIFEGLETKGGDRSWNYVLAAVARPYWPAFRDFIGSVILSNRSWKRVTRLGVQPTRVADPLARERQGAGTAGAVLPVAVFCVDRNDLCIVLLGNKRAVLSPMASTVRMARQLFADSGWDNE
jgi:hypothetical protein